MGDIKLEVCMLPCLIRMNCLAGKGLEREKERKREREKERKKEKKKKKKKR